MPATLRQLLRELSASLAARKHGPLLQHGKTLFVVTTLKIRNFSRPRKESLLDKLASSNLCVLNSPAFFVRRVFVINR